jgi:outer membrane receptor protein involved in Fe transport
MRAPTGLAILSVLIHGAAATAETSQFRINIHEASTAGSLQELAHQTGIELLFDRNMIGGYRSEALRGRFTVETALHQLLNNTGLSVRKAASGAWIIERPTRGGESYTPILDVPEILVVGRRSHDADIRRSENDIQPHYVSTGQQIVDAHRDNIDQYFQSRVTPNTETLPPGLQPYGATNSLIDLRGLGSSQTLILVDGRRMPGIATVGLETGQPDINPIPLHAIDRIETFTGTAGGIYGLGALGGVVNVVLRHDYHGIELHATSGISARGDAPRLNLEGGFGFTPDDGRTDVSLYGSYSLQRPLRIGQRDLALRARDAIARFAPDTFADRSPDSNSISVISASGDSLILKPEYGGTSLGSSRTFIPEGSGDAQSDLINALVQHAGQLDLAVSRGERESGITSTPRTASLIGAVRHRFGGGVEAYFDALILRDWGRYRDLSSVANVALSPNSPFNPFQQAVSVALPGPVLDSYSRTLFSSERYTGGIIVALPFHWRANAEAIFGSSGYRNESAYAYLDSPDFTGVTCPGVDPFGDPDARLLALSSCRHLYLSTDRANSRYREQSLRLAGPLFRTRAGPATLTILLQNRTETIPGSSEDTIDDRADPPDFSSDYSGSAIRTRSIYGELAAPLIARDAGLPLIDGLSAQLAIRHDQRKAAFATYTDTGDIADVHPRFAGTMYTAGVKFYPLPWLMLRGSFATGQQPPSLEDLGEYDFVEYLAELADPKRGNTMSPDDGDYEERFGGLDLKQVRASTFALGMVLNPDGDHGPRISIDYSHTRRTGDVTDRSANYVVAHEDMFPGRVTRAPLTDEDRAKGYTGGVIVAVDARGLSLGQLTAASVDGRLDWRMPLGSGMLRITGNATWQLSNRVSGPEQLPFQRVGFSDGPLAWRANGGAEWTVGGTMVGANVQYFSRYRVVGSDLVSVAYLTEAAQGSKYVSAQAYVDLYASHRFHIHWAGADRQMSVDLAAINVFDHTPPFQSSSSYYGGPQFSLYGDPRQRRFELTLNAGF